MINKELLDKIQELNFWHKEQETGIRREELSQMLKFVDDKDSALVIAGVRRAGKTYLSRQILKEKIKKVKPEQTLYINFEDPSLEPFLNVESLTTFYNTYRYFLNKNNFAYVVLDEVHNVPKWEKWVRIMLEKKENAKFIITGSSSKVFKGKLSRVLTGRAITFSLFPLSFKNFLKFKNYKIKKYESYGSLEMLLNEYLEYGGFPLVVLTDREKKNVYLKELFEDIVVKDIITKYKLREPDIKKLAVLLVNNFSSLTSVKRLQNLMYNIARTKISPTTTSKYLYYFKNAFLFFFLPIFSYKIKDVLQYPRKVYNIDTGLINAINLRFSENIGRIYENAVGIELLRRYGNENLFYWKSQHREVDFVIKERLKIKQLVQVCYDIRDKKTKEREILALTKASKELRCKDLLVITEDYKKEEKMENGKVKFIPLWEWLLLVKS